MKLKQSFTTIVFLLINILLISPSMGDVNLENMGTSCAEQGTGTPAPQPSILEASLEGIIRDIDALSRFSYSQKCLNYYSDFLARLKKKGKIVEFEVIRDEMAGEAQNPIDQEPCLDRLTRAVHFIGETLKRNKVTPEQCEDLRSKFKVTPISGNLTIPELEKAIREQITTPLEMYPAIAIVCLGYDEKGVPLSDKASSQKKEETELEASLPENCAPYVSLIRENNIDPLTITKEQKKIVFKEKDSREKREAAGCVEKLQALAAKDSTQMPPTTPKPQGEVVVMEEIKKQERSSKEISTTPETHKIGEPEPRKLSLGTTLTPVTGIVKDATSSESVEDTDDIDEDEVKGKTKTTHVAGGGSSSGSSSSGRSDFPETAKPRVERPNMGFVFRCKRRDLI